MRIVGSGTFTTQASVFTVKPVPSTGRLSLMTSSAQSASSSGRKLTFPPQEQERHSRNSPNFLGLRASCSLMAMPEIHTTEVTLVEAAMAGDRDAFAGLVSLERDRLVMTARAIVGNFHEGEDCAQDAFVSAWRALPSLEDPAKFRPWLLTILTREAIQRRRRPGLRLLRTDPGRIEARESPEHDRLTRLVTEMERLPERYRLLLSLHYLAGLSYSEVSETVGITEARVKSRLFDARKMLERRLGHE